MVSIDHEANLLFDSLFLDNVLFRPCVDPDGISRHACNLCTTTLEWAYMENRLYAIRCPKCKTVTLIRERCASEAASIVGYEDEVPEEEPHARD